MRVSAILLLACGCTTACSVSPPVARENLSPAGPRATEDQIFDANRTTPVHLLRAMYEKNKVLVLGFRSHDSATQYQLLDSLLQEIGHDPRLKFIVLERAGEDAPMLETESTTELTMSDLISRFSSKQRASLSLCMDDEWAYTWATFLPRIRALNAQRPSAHKILVMSVDGIALSQAARYWSPPDHGFSNSPMSTILSIMEGEYRETATSVNFGKVLWNTLGPSDKVIMLYNVGHVIKTFTVLNAKDDRVPHDWMAIFLHDHPEAESHIGIVLLDENTENTDQMKPLLNFTQRQADRYPNQAWGVNLAPFRGIITERDTAVYSSQPLRSFGEAPSSRSPLPAMLDGVVWLPKTQQWRLLGDPSAYLPIPCGH